MTKGQKVDAVPQHLRVDVPASPPVLTPLAAQALLKLLLDIHNQPAEDEQTLLVWDRTG